MIQKIDVHDTQCQDTKERGAVKALNAIADRMVRMIVPKAEAAAACSGCWIQCNVHSCPGSAALFRCCYKANCTDTCSRIGTCYC